MLKKFQYLALTLLIALSQALSANFYLHLDNHTPASMQDLLDDPFLVLRTKCQKRTEKMDFNHSCEKWADLSLINLSIDEGTLDEEKTDFIESEHISISLLDPQPFFDYCKPCFHLMVKGEETPAKVWWQICANPHFCLVHPNLEEISSYQDTIILSDIAETFLNPGKTYYFRARTESSQWSSPYAFQVGKPQAIREVKFIKKASHVYQISWKGQVSPTIEYMVFGSNAFDFIPEIYTNKQIHALYQGEMINSEPNCNLVAIVSHPFIQVDSTYAYYRVIARDRGQLSVPSSMIYIYDKGLQQTRTILQKDRGDWTVRRDLPSLACAYYDPTSVLSLGTPKRYRDKYPYNPFVPLEIWQKLEPFFLPANHPIKAKLDRIFHSQRVTLSKETFEEAGFGKVKERKPTNIFVGNHPELKGFIIKVYLDTQPALKEWENWIDRIQGAKAIRDFIQQRGYTKLFKVPQKWIYPLPIWPSPPNNSLYNRKNFILIVEDMDILDHKDCLHAYKTEVTPEILDALFLNLKEVGLLDSTHAANVPFTKDGRMAFIDTEHHHKWPVPYFGIKCYFSNPMQAYWQKLIDQGGP